MPRLRKYEQLKEENMHMPNTVPSHKKAESELISKQINEWLSKGNKIDIIPIGVTRETLRDAAKAKLERARKINES